VVLFLSIPFAYPGSSRAKHGMCDAVRMVSFNGRVRRWRDDQPGGLAVVDVPADLVPELGGRRQMRVSGELNGAPYTGSTMLVAGGGLCVGVSKAALNAAGAAVGDQIELSIAPAAKTPA
jgi:hypothetical protein